MTFSEVLKKHGAIAWESGHICTTSYHIHSSLPKHYHTYHVPLSLRWPLPPRKPVGLGGQLLQHSAIIFGWWNCVPPTQLEATKINLVAYNAFWIEME